jgi:hypothetical protein
LGKAEASILLRASVLKEATHSGCISGWTGKIPELDGILMDWDMLVNRGWLLNRRSESDHLL